MEGFPVEKSFDSFWMVSVQSDVDGDFEKFEEIGDELFCQISDDFFRNSSEIKDNVRQDVKVEVPHAFPFPFQPYGIQLDLMRKLYEALELGKVGIFESPTGTGKSLSLICGALTWLKNFEEQKQRELNAILGGQSLSEKEISIKQEGGLQENCTGDDWISEFARKQELEEKAKKLKDEQEQRLRREAKLQQLKNNLRPNPVVKRKRNSLDDQFEELFKDASEELKKKFEFELASGDTGEVDEADDDFVVAEYVSDDDSAEENKKAMVEDNKEEHVTKIYYCSRTHSQLAQFVREVQKSPFRDQTHVVTLGSRQNLCINEAVKRLKSLSLVNDRCIELQKNKSVTKATDGDKVTKKQKCSGCPFYKQEAVIEFRDRILIEIKDIEQLVTMGKQVKACPYYGTRFAVPSAQLVVLPYNTLLHKSTRESCGIKLNGNVVIIDEGHNLMETITNIHSVEVTGSQLCCAYSQLSQYVDRFRQRLKAKNIMYIKQLLFILSNFIKALGGKAGSFADVQMGKTVNKIQTINDFLFDTHLDNLNLFKVQRYCERSMIAKKLHGFIEKYHGQVNTAAEKKKENAEPTTWALSNFLTEINQSKESSHSAESEEKPQDPSVKQESQVAMSSPLMHIEGLLEALTNADKDGRIVVNKLETLSKSSVKFLLLNPAVHFAEILSEARSVIIAGGTMQPVSEFKEQLLFATGLKPERILEFSCGHIISADQLLPIAMARGSSGLELDFTYQSRATPEMMNELGRVVYNVSNVVSGGIICFFPSYEYEKTVYAHWEQAGFLQKIGAMKKIFREPKQANQVEKMLQEYTLFIQRHAPTKKSQFDGAVLCCVVGGKMSEGINFSDELGRCVIMIGLPYPNVRSPELKEKMDYLNANMPRSSDGNKLPGQIHFENLCMKAVNQSIGRAIRHKDDFAAILLLDHRYMRASVKSKLPGWINERLQVIERFGPAFASIRKFFNDRAVERSVKCEPS